MIPTSYTPAIGGMVSPVFVIAVPSPFTLDNLVYSIVFEYKTMLP
jgi:hypothetical protein